MARARISLLLGLLAILSCGGCATTVGLVAGPVTGPVTFWRHTHGTPTWLVVLLTPLAAPVGPVLGFCEGLRADLGYVAHGEYGVYPVPPFEIVFDPANPELGRPDWDESWGDEPAHDAYVKWGSLADRRSGDAASPGAAPE